MEERGPAISLGSGTSPEESLRVDHLSRAPWWLDLIAGGLWLVFAFVVLSFDYRTVWAIAVFAAVSFMFAGVDEFATALNVREWRWLHGLLGVLSIGAGVIALAWPGITILVLAAIIGWYLLFQGAFDIAASLIFRHDLWGLRLTAGAVEVVIAFWAIGYPGRSFVLLAVWVAAAAVMRGIGEIILGVAIRDAQATPTASGQVRRGAIRSDRFAGGMNRRRTTFSS